MTNLLNKEFRLAAMPLTYVFIAASFMTLIPGYPILVGTFFVCLGIFYSFQNARESNDVLFSLLLPIGKSDFVKAKYLFCAFIQMTAFAIMSLLTALRMTVLSQVSAYVENPMMNATPVYLAFVLIIFSLFNTVFLAGFFKTAWKIGVPFLVFGALAFVVIVAAEALHHIPALSFLNATYGERPGIQFAALAVAALIYAASFALSCKRSISRFERIDL